MSHWSGLAIVACLSAAAAAGVRAQNPAAAPTADHPEQYPASDVASGSKIYSQYCVPCHGISGTSVGGIDLHHGLLPRASTDAALRSVIATGFPQAGMPAFHLTDDEVRTLIAFIRAGDDPAAAGAAVKLGDVAKGRAIFEGKGKCLSCHRVGLQGAFSGPDLTDVGRTRVPSSLQRSVLDPTQSMRPINRPVRAVTRDGQTITGRRLNEDTYTVQVITDDGRLVGLVKSELKGWSVGTASPMPSYKDTLSADELSDLVAYLVSLKG
jgi:putative heme-binding domain-containing protein